MEISTKENSEITLKKPVIGKDSNAEQSSESLARSGASLEVDGPTVQTEDLTSHASRLDGLPLGEFARQNGLAEADVWKRLRRGELIGRTHRGKLIIFTHLESGLPEFEQEANELAAYDDGMPESGSSALEALDPAAERLKADLNDLPPLPGESTRIGAMTTAPSYPNQDLVTLESQRTSSPEIALLLDHLSLAKEENREILRMTQESIRKVSELTESLVDMKDAVIDAKDAQLQALKDQLKASDRQNASLKQQNEDLEMLTRSLAESD